MKVECNTLRVEILDLSQKVLALKPLVSDAARGAHSAQEGEMHANIMLAYRHLEDARMRLGKVIQALMGGQSSFDKT